MDIVQRPIELGEALGELETIIANIRLKNTTLINYYIHPDPTPTHIAAFEPRLAALDERRKDLAAVSVAKISMLFDSAQAVVGSQLVPIAQQLAAAIDQFQALFVQHYDRTLGTRQPYLPLFQRLRQLEQDLGRFIQFQLQNPNRRSAAQILGNPSQTEPSFCPASVAFINNADRGRIQQCMIPSELTTENKALLKAEGGLFLWWECALCAFRLRFHISNSAGMNINSTAEIRRHDDVDYVAYRSSWLVKSHVYHPGRDEQVQERERRRAGRKTSVSVNTSGVGGVKFGCLFCFSKGKELAPKETAFANAKDLAVHVSGTHLKELPAAILLQNFKVGVNNKPPPKVPRWDLNLGNLQ